MNPGHPLPRHRLHSFFLVLAVIAAGLFWRSGIMPLPDWLSNSCGEALWALMVFSGFGFLFPTGITIGALRECFSCSRRD